MFIVFEGVDGCGKTLLSKQFCEYLKESSGSFWHWTKEPLFTSDQADRLNNKEYMQDEFKRESLFFESRLRHQETLAGFKNIICDRYVWSGFAYAKIYSPNCFDFLTALYLNDKIFIQPSLYIYVDTPVEVCNKRRNNVPLKSLKNIQDSYRNTRTYIQCPIIDINGNRDSVEEALENLKHLTNGIIK